jgi:hypothetical protein
MKIACDDLPILHDDWVLFLWLGSGGFLKTAIVAAHHELIPEDYAIRTCGSAVDMVMV